MHPFARKTGWAVIRSLTMLVGVALLLESIGAQAALAWAPDVKAPAPGAKHKSLEGFQLQPLDEPLKTLEPKTPETAVEKKKVEAAARFMTGQLKESKGDPKGALEAYRKAIELDPTAIRVYRVLVPLEFSDGNPDAAVQFALKAVEVDPQDFRLLHWLGRHMALKGKTDEAIALLEKASKSKELSKESGSYIILASHLAILYSAAGQKEKSADAFQIVFDALVAPEKYKLDFRTRAELLKDENTSFERIGQAFLDAGRTELAVKAFERAAESRKGQPATLSYNLARVYLQTKQLDKALEELQKYFDAQLQSKGRDAYALLADILAAQNKSAELVGRLEKLAEKDAHNAALQSFLADKYVDANRLDEAEKLYKQVVEKSSDNEGYVGLAAIYRRQNKSKELLEAIVKSLQSGKQLERLEGEIQSIAKDEKQLDALLAAGRELAAGDKPRLEMAGCMILAKMAASGDKTDAAIEFYRIALKLAHDGTGVQGIQLAQQRSIVIYNELGEYFAAVGKYDEAAKLYEDAANDPLMRPVRWSLLRSLARALELGGKTAQAVSAITEAKKLHPDEALLHFDEAWIHSHAKQWDQAISLFEQLIAKFPDDKEVVRRAQLSLSNVYVERGDKQKGEQVLEKILADDPDDPSINNDLGYLYADDGKNLAKAESMIRKAMQAEPDNPAYLDSMGWVLFKLGKVDEAVGYLEKAVAKPTGTDPTILEHLGDCYDRLKKTDKATEAWQKAVDHAQKESPPDPETIKRVRQKLEKTKTAAKDAAPVKEPASKDPKAP